MATELGKAYVQIIPSAKGIGAMLATEVGGASATAGLAAGKALGTSIIGALGALGLGKMLKDTLTTGMDFDKAMSQVAATMGKTMAEMQTSIETVDLSWGTFTGNLRDYAREIGANTIYSAEEAAEALNYMALAGYDVKTSMEMLPNVLSLAAAGNFDLAKASDMVTDTQTAFGISLDRTTHLVDEMAKAASTGNTSVEQLGDAFLVVGGLAKELNGGMIKLADGTTAEVDNITELQIALTAMANAGIKGSEAGTHMRNMLLKLASPTTEGTKQLKKLGVEVFDAEGKMRSLNDIFADLSTSLGKLTQQEKLQAISDLFNTRDTASVSALLSAVNSDWNAIGESILDCQGAAEKMMDTQWDNLAGDIKRLKSAFDDLKIELSDRLSPSLRDAAKNATGFITAITTGLKTGNWSELKGIGEKILTSITDAFKDRQVNMSTLLDGILNYINTNLSDFTTAGENIIQSVLDGASAKLADTIALGNSIIASVATGIEQNLPTLIQSAGNLARMFIAYVMENAPTVIEGGISLIKSLAQGIVQSAPEIIASIRTAISNARAEFLTHLPEFLEWGIELIGQIASGIIKNLPAINSSIKNIKDEIRLDLSNVDWSELGKKIIVAIARGLLNARHSIDEAIVSLIRQITSKFTSTDWAATGILIPQNIAKGIVNGIRFILNAIEQIIAQIKKAFGMSWVEVGRGISSDIASGIGQINSPVTALSSLVKNMLSVVNSADFKTPGKNLGEALAAGINQGKSSAVAAMDSLVSAIKAKANEAQQSAGVASSIIHAQMKGAVGEATMYGAVGEESLDTEAQILNILERLLPAIAQNTSNSQYDVINRQMGWGVS